MMLFQRTGALFKGAGTLFKFPHLWVPRLQILNLVWSDSFGLDLTGDGDADGTMRPDQTSDGSTELTLQHSDRWQKCTAELCSDN